MATRNMSKDSTRSGKVLRSFVWECSNWALNIKREYCSWESSKSGRVRNGSGSCSRLMSFRRYCGLAGRLKRVVSYRPPFVNRSCDLINRFE